MKRLRSWFIFFILFLASTYHQPGKVEMVEQIVQWSSVEQRRMSAPDTMYRQHRAAHLCDWRY
jgi:hypothetical protein